MMKAWTKCAEWEDNLPNLSGYVRKLLYFSLRFEHVHVDLELLIMISVALVDLKRTSEVDQWIWMEMRV